jgi:hypothetical protein
MPTKTDVLEQIEAEGVDFLRLQFIDILGTVKNVSVPAHQAEKAFEEGIYFDGSSIEGFVRIQESDMRLDPDPDTFAVLPWRSRRGDDTVGPDAAEPAPVTDPDVAAVARAAGRAADRIAGDAAVDNEVFRAWAAMTDALDLESPETVTPAAFEAAAVDAGMTPDDVAELRRLFEEVRYGGQSPSDERERQAVSALRRIEDEYGDLDANAEDH